MKTLIVGQSGGPTSVINGSLAGVYYEAKKKGFDKVYGMLNGIEGLLKERIIDLDEYLSNKENIELLTQYPFLEIYKKDNNEIYENNFDLFFTELKDKLNILDRFEENFLIIYSKRLDKSFFFKIFFRLMKLGLLDENTVKQKNNLGNTCY
jgi:hypothetical protein